MLSRNKIFFVLFLLVVLSEMLAPALVQPIDEFMLMLFLLVIMLDLIVNRDFARYKTLFVLEGIFLSYFCISVMFRDYNSVRAIANDFILQQKAYVPFVIAYAMAPTFTPAMKTVLKWSCIGTSAVLVVIFTTGLTNAILGHVYHYGTISVSVALLYLYCCMDGDGKSLSRRDLLVGLLLLSVGLIGSRSKFYGEYVSVLFMFLVYRPGMVRKMNFKHAAVMLAAVAIVLVVAWNKIEFYFISGSAAAVELVVDSENIDSAARPVLYATMFLILGDYPVFGSGLASFASHSSSAYVNYSGLYNEYGIDIVYGLSPKMSDYVSDTYYPVLAQFGFVGIGLFIYFWAWIWRKLRIVLHEGRTTEFAIGVSAICFVMIENVASATILQIGGYVPMMLLGLIVGKYRTMSKEERKRIILTDYKN